MTRHWARAAAMLVLLASTVAACRTQGIVFMTDERLEILLPEDRADVVLPVTVAWTVRDFAVGSAGEPGGSFLVTVDRSPMPPGEGIDAFVRDDDGCRGTALRACLRRAFLAERGIHQTRRSSIMFRNIARNVGVSDEQKDRHEVTVTLLDEHGKRISEAAWTVTFTVTG